MSRQRTNCAIMCAIVQFNGIFCISFTFYNVRHTFAMQFSAYLFGKVGYFLPKTKSCDFDHCEGQTQVDKLCNSARPKGGRQKRGTSQHSLNGRLKNPLCFAQGERNVYKRVELGGVKNCVRVPVN